MWRCCAKTTMARRLLAAAALGSVLLVVPVSSADQGEPPQGLELEPVAGEARTGTEGRSAGVTIVSQSDDLSGAVIISGELSVAESIRLALTHNPTLQIIRRERERSRGAVLEARSGFLPDVTLSAQYFRRVKVPSISIGPVTQTLGSENNWFLGATLTQPLYLGGSVTNTYRAELVGEDVAEEQVRQATQNVIFDARKAYYDILVAQEFLAADREQLVRAEAFLSDVKKRFAQGLASRFDVLRSQVAVANASASLIQSQNGLHLKDTSFLRVLGVSQDSKVTLTDKLEYESISPDVRAAMAEALLNRPEVRSSKLSVKSQQYRVEATKAGVRPRIFFIGDYMLSKPAVGGFTPGWDDEFQAIVSFELPLFEGFQTAGKLVQERALLDQFRTTVRDSEEQVLLEVTQAFLSLEDADEFVQSQRVNLQQAREGLRLAEVGFREGIRKQVEVLDARAALTEARKNFSQAVFDHMVARLSLERATGALAQAAVGPGTPAGAEEPGPKPRP